MECETCSQEYRCRTESGNCLHGPSKHGAQVLDTELLGHELMLSSDVVVKRDFGEVLQRWVVGR